MNTALEEGRTMDSMRPQLEIYEEQIQAIDDQIDQITAQQTQETMQKRKQRKSRKISSLKQRRSFSRRNSTR